MEAQTNCQKQCLICFDQLKEPVMCNKCKNYFCTECATKWKIQKNECPIRCHCSPWEIDLEQSDIEIFNGNSSNLSNQQIFVEISRFQIQNRESQSNSRSQIFQNTDPLYYHTSAYNNSLNSNVLENENGQNLQEIQQIIGEQINDNDILHSDSLTNCRNTQSDEEIKVSQSHIIMSISQMQIRNKYNQNNVSQHFEPQREGWPNFIHNFDAKLRFTQHYFEKQYHQQQDVYNLVQQSNNQQQQNNKKQFDDQIIEEGCTKIPNYSDSAQQFIRHDKYFNQ